MNIEVLASNRPRARFYRGGARIADFRGDQPYGSHEPEDWVGSVTAVAGEDHAGRTTLADGRSLADAISADPQAWLGDTHVTAFGADPMLLVKLLDAGQRLPVHAHPDRDWAAAHVAASHGKTEAWHILTAGPVYLGLTHDLARVELDRIVEAQDTTMLLSVMHRVDVHPGDTVHVPAGMLHAIGAGILLVELQEPEDLSILVEWNGFAIDGSVAGHLGVGFETALGAVETRARSAAEIEHLVHRHGEATSLLPPEADAFFRVERIVVDAPTRLSRGYGVLVVLDGDVTITARDAAPEPLLSGSTVLVPHAAGAVLLDGQGVVLVCRPPHSP